MTHKDCGGKLQVIDTVQKQDGKCLIIKRIRVCKKCGDKIMSTEVVHDADVSNAYKHRSYYC